MVLLSGGLDSATAAAIARAQGFSLYALSFAYGQRQGVEVAAARRVAAALGVVEHRVITLDLAAHGGSALTSDVPVPKNRSLASIGRGIPVTYVPARNTIFLAHALAWAEVLGAYDLVLGVNAVDYSGYPDCRPRYITAFAQLANLATAAGVSGRRRFRVHAPLMHMRKAEIIRRGTELGVDYRLTHTCYDPVGELACGRCDACRLRRRGLVEAGGADPTRYVSTAPRPRVHLVRPPRPRRPGPRAAAR
ncbi:MAG: 7-cyano-7-deazaguanine synthase QueC [Deltaproteobacteria bacterium]|nr:7-cyano-7-deazaguanine synthase QueC [Deltaproteobacteria bacterium]